MKVATYNLSKIVRNAWYLKKVAAVDDLFGLPA